jgi:two-component system, cell cycle response regulator
MPDTHLMDQILIVEDDRFFRELYADLLRQAGYGAETACSGEEAVEMLVDSRFGLVITDLTMPGISGLELLVKIKSRDPSIDVILVTANADLESAIFSIKYGARDFLLKPINSDELLHVVRLCMEQRHLLDENVELRNMLGLLQTSQALASCLDLEGVCHLAVDALAREVGVGRGIGMVFLEGEFTTKELKGLDEATADRLHKIIAPSLRKRSSRKGQPLRVLLPTGHAELEHIDLREAILFPLTIKNGCLGVIVLFNDPGQMLPLLKNERNLTFLEEHGARALDNALRFTATRDLLYIDELSGLFNYRYLKVALEREIKRADRYSTHLSVVFLDLDNFKGVNDTYGHLVGSNLLKEIGVLLKKSVREVDVVIRYGGDEYTIILVETGPDAAMQVGERIRKTIEGTGFFEREGYQIKLTASLGFACYPEDTTGVDELLAMADKAMYAGKAAGKNCIYRIVSPLVGCSVLDKEQQ